jgi:hypothetical protein
MDRGPETNLNLLLHAFWKCNGAYEAPLFKDKSYMYDMKTNVDLEKAFRILQFQRFSIWFADVTGVQNAD